jgi:hypothetical protein
LNILRPGSTMPLTVYFVPPLPEDFQAHSEIVSALPIKTDDPRYLNPEVKVDSVKISDNGGTATISGTVVLPDGALSISQFWVLGVAYDVEGNIIGSRKWKSAGETEFEFNVYSLGGVIDHVETLVEARP